MKLEIRALEAARAFLEKMEPGEVLGKTEKKVIN